MSKPRLFSSFFILSLIFLLHGVVWSDDAQPFSGKSSDYSDTYNGFKFKLPAEFVLENRGATTTWHGPMLDGGATTISVNAVEMKGVPSKILYDTNFKSKKQDRDYTDVVPVKVPLNRLLWKKNKPVYAFAFRCKEAEHKAGSPEKKDPGDIHRWNLFIFGNGRFYTCGFTGMMASFDANKLQSVYDKVISSFELIPVK